jgi:uncharacterized protein (DUF58 family)
MRRTPAPPPAPSPESAAPRAAERLLARLEWTVLKRLAGQLEGDHRTLFRGLGLDLADLREYQPSDDVRHIDWNVTARLQEPHVRQFQQDRDITAWFLLDCSGSVDFGARDVSKRSVATAFVATLARLLAGRGNRVGAMLYGDTLDAVLPPGAGRRQVLQLVQRLLAYQPACARPTDLSQLLQRAGALMRRRAMVFVVSDFFSTPGWDVPLGRLAQRHDVLAVRLVDPLERELPDVGILTLQDAETGERQWVDTHDRGFRRRFEAVVARREAALEVAFNDAGVDVLELGTDDDLFDVLRRFIELRRLRSRLAAGAVHTPRRPSAAALGV